ncbi:hypothetical protein PV409_36260 [Streptomyces sp. ME02-6979.5a]|uniref:hypothetical protein n=1 Tax=Streptomyces sp. ME02-6979.5a TaxID=462925 RepID=UPI0029B08674|nr:hypothetical protein [Streptomyces sp. ME02-6979.5a]MDX3343415.1 hypothetical protein [Streptomyces sp. ME02-6979.5a]
MNQRSRITGQTAPTTTTLPSSEFLTDFARRLNQPSQTGRVFTPETLRFTLLMSARLTHQCAQYNATASRVWNDNKNGNYHTRETRERAIREAADMADYAWDEATLDTDRAYTALVDTTAPSMTGADLLDRIARLLVPGTGRRLMATGIRRGNGRLVIKAVAA